MLDRGFLVLGRGFLLLRRRWRRLRGCQGFRLIQLFLLLGRRRRFRLRRGCFRLHRRCGSLGLLRLRHGHCRCRLDLRLIRGNSIVRGGHLRGGRRGRRHERRPACEHHVRRARVARFRCRALLVILFHECFTLRSTVGRLFIGRRVLRLVSLIGVSNGRLDRLGFRGRLDLLHRFLLGRIRGLDNLNLGLHAGSILSLDRLIGISRGRLDRLGFRGRLDLLHRFLLGRIRGLDNLNLGLHAGSVLSLDRLIGISRARLDRLGFRGRLDRLHRFRRGSIRGLDVLDGNGGRSLLDLAGLDGRALGGRALGRRALDGRALGGLVLLLGGGLSRDRLGLGVLSGSRGCLRSGVRGGHGSGSNGTSSASACDRRGGRHGDGSLRSRPLGRSLGLSIGALVLSLLASLGVAVALDGLDADGGQSRGRLVIQGLVSAALASLVALLDAAGVGLALGEDLLAGARQGGRAFIGIGGAGEEALTAADGRGRQGLRELRILVAGGLDDLA